MFASCVSFENLITFPLRDRREPCPGKANGWQSPARLGRGALSLIRVGTSFETLRVGTQNNLPLPGMLQYKLITKSTHGRADRGTAGRPRSPHAASCTARERPLYARAPPVPVHRPHSLTSKDVPHPHPDSLMGFSAMTNACGRQRIGAKCTAPSQSLSSHV